MGGGRSPCHHRLGDAEAQHPCDRLPGNGEDTRLLGVRSEQSGVQLQPNDEQESAREVRARGGEGKMQREMTVSY